MKLCLVNAFFRPYVGGTEKHMYELGRRLARRHEVHVFTAQLPDTSRTEEIEGVHVWRTPARFLRAPLIYPPPLPLARGAMEDLAEIDAVERFDAFHLHGRWFPDFAGVVRYAHDGGRPVALTLHNARPKGINPLTDSFGTAYDRLYGIRVIQEVDRAVAVSDWVKQDIVQYGVDPAKIDVIPNGVDTAVYRPRKPELRDRLGGFDPLLLSVGRLVPQKGLDLLVEAFARLAADHPGLGLAIVGKGKARADLERDVRRRGLERRIVFTDFLEESLLPVAYSSADAFVLPSLWEVFGIVLLEAMACGLPCVAADVGGIPEVVADGRTGLLFQRGDAGALAERLRIVVEDEPLRRRMATEARRRAVDVFDWDRIADRTALFYDALLASPPRRAG